MNLGSDRIGRDPHRNNCFVCAGQLDVEAESAFYRSIAEVEIHAEDVATGDWARIAEQIETDADLGLDTADASIVALAEQHEQDAVATLDHWTRVVRPVHTDAFEVRP